MRSLIIADIELMMKRPYWCMVQSEVFETMYRCWNMLPYFDVPLSDELQTDFESFRAEGFQYNRISDRSLLYLYKVISQKMSTDSKELFRAQSH